MEDNLERDYNTTDKIEFSNDDVTSFIARNVVNSVNQLKSSLIITSSISGYTAKMISSYRPGCPILVITPNEQTARSLSLNYGTIPVITPMFNNTDDIIANGLNEAKNNVT